MSPEEFEWTNRAVAIIVEWQDAVPGVPRPRGRTLAELIVAAIRENVTAERSAAIEAVRSVKQKWREAAVNDRLDEIGVLESVEDKIRVRGER